MPTKKTAAAKKPRYVDIRIRFTAENRDVIAAAAARRGLGFNLFVRLVSAGIAEQVLKKASAEELLEPFLDVDSVMSRITRLPADHYVE
jgi:uncharacterized protein (DUF1778 family)